MRIVQSTKVLTTVKLPVSDEELKVHLSNAQKRSAMSLAEFIPVNWWYDKDGNIVIEAHAYLLEPTMSSTPKTTV
jgi:hypothetical protein